MLQGERPMAAENKTHRPLHPGRHPARAARHAADRGDLRHRRQRHPERLGQGQGHRPGAEDHDQPSSGLSKDEIEQHGARGEVHAEEDKRRREEIETRNQADSAAYRAEKLLRDNADKVPADLKTEVEGKIAAVRSALQGSQTRPTSAARWRTSNASLQKVGQAVYGAQQGAGRPQGGQPGATRRRRPAGRPGARRHRRRRVPRGLDPFLILPLPVGAGSSSPYAHGGRHD